MAVSWAGGQADIFERVSHGCAVLQVLAMQFSRGIVIKDVRCCSRWL